MRLAPSITFVSPNFSPNPPDIMSGTTKSRPSHGNFSDRLAATSPLSAIAPAE
jgi:hypothetical protein